MMALLSGCSSLQTETEKYHRLCEPLLLDSEIYQCYSRANSHLFAKQIELATKRLTEGDWPHSFQAIVQLQVESSGRFQVVSLSRSSESRMLDKKIMQAINGVHEMFVPKGELFETSGFSRLRLLIKPARTPLLGEESLVDNGAVVVYVNRVRR
ncbi:MAG: TonB C-terminal domain-containing protein [Gammaproteobacteria bacterium]|nr:TonB C-terminal domain-containing protein [Gammaproteobacteria bacterium]